jgi:hypothetical protein
MLQPGTWLSRALAIVLLTIALVCGYSFVLLPISKISSDARRRSEQSTALLQHYKWLIEQHSAFRDEIAEQLSLVRTFESAYLRGPSSASAVAELLNLTKAVLERAGGKISSIGIVIAKPKSSQANVHRIGLKLQVELPLPGLGEALYALESGKPYVVIDELIVNSEAAEQSTGSAAEPLVGVTLRVFGILLDESEAAK